METGVIPEYYAVGESVLGRRAHRRAGRDAISALYPFSTTSPNFTISGGPAVSYIPACARAGMPAVPGSAWLGVAEIQPP